ncbi:YkvA family protein [Chelativorans xinjiangense]|uniref:YkvA family protein n=1 Tax=Chelativorans xinjiangense TaxID=2681485 RepID=UPI001357AE10|nr:YkvA family protein [Chelativorans xinjiangense]
MDDVKIGEILVPGSADEHGRHEEDVRRKFWRTAKKAARQVPFMEDVIAGYYCALDRETPPRVRGILLAALAYFVLPLDMVPDFLAGFGFTDDMAVLAAALGAVRSHITPAHRLAAKRALEDAE